MSDGTMTGLLMQWLSYSAPGLLMHIAGCIIAACYLTKAPRPATYALAGCGLCLFCSGLSLVPHLVMTGKLGVPMSLVTVAQVVSHVSGILYMIGFGLVFAGVFVDRRRPEPPPVIE